MQPGPSFPVYPFTLEVVVEEAGEQSKLQKKFETGASDILSAIKPSVNKALIDLIKDLLAE